MYRKLEQNACYWSWYQGNFWKKIFKTTRDTCLRWFQYKLLYNVLPTGRFLFQRGLVDSPVCVFCKRSEETLIHLFWDCPKIQDYWFDVQGWLHSNFTHCTDVVFFCFFFSKELVILGSKENVVTARVLDLRILIAKYNIFIWKLYGTIPHENIFVSYVKNRSAVEKYYCLVNSRQSNFFVDWMLYSSLFSESFDLVWFCFDINFNWDHCWWLDNLFIFLFLCFVVVVVF